MAFRSILATEWYETQQPVSSVKSVAAHDVENFRMFGARIAALRKDQGMTQLQFAEILGLTQQMIASYEVRRRRVPVSLLPQIAETLAVSLEELSAKRACSPPSEVPPQSCSNRSSVSSVCRAPNSVLSSRCSTPSSLKPAVKSGHRGSGEAFSCRAGS